MPCRKSVSDTCAGQWLPLHNHRKVERENKPPETTSEPRKMDCGKERRSVGPWPTPRPCQAHWYSPVHSSSSPWKVRQAAGVSVLGKQLSEASPVGAGGGRGESCCCCCPCAAGNAVLEKTDPENGPKVQVRKQMCKRALVSGSRLRLGPVYQTLRQGLKTCIKDS